MLVTRIVSTTVAFHFRVSSRDPTSLQTCVAHLQYPRNLGKSAKAPRSVFVQLALHARPRDSWSPEDEPHLRSGATCLVLTTKIICVSHYLVHHAKNETSQTYSGPNTMAPNTEQLYLFTAFLRSIREPHITHFFKFPPNNPVAR
jgi:hypothetical protein